MYGRRLAWMDDYLKGLRSKSRQLGQKRGPVPVLRAHSPQARLVQTHIDLRFVLASLGYRGGLKAVERNLGLSRDPMIQGVDGFEAVRLWSRYPMDWSPCE